MGHSITAVPHFCVDSVDSRRCVTTATCQNLYPGFTLLLTNYYLKNILLSLCVFSLFGLCLLGNNQLNTHLLEVCGNSGGYAAVGYDGVNLINVAYLAETSAAELR